MRFGVESFFGDQEGDFALTINSLAATTTTDLGRSRRSVPDGTVDNTEKHVRSDHKDHDDNGIGKPHELNSEPGATSWLDWLKGVWSR